MTTQFNTGRGSSSGTLLAVLLSLLLGATVVIVFMRNTTAGLPARLAGALLGRTTHIDTSAPVVVEKIRRLNRLETVVYSLDTVVEGNKTSAVLPDLLGGDRILLIAHGQSVAGIDLAQLRPEDVRVDGQSIHVTLPASQIFSTALDNQHTRVYVRSTGLLVPADQNLESDTRAQAETQIGKAALEDGILDAARKNARATVTTLLFSLGFQQVEVN